MTQYDEDQRIHFRRQAEEWLAAHGWQPGELQMIWRSLACFERPYDQTEVGYAIIDALVREGCTAWWGDGTSCVEQMIRLQVQRAERAESKVTRQQDAISRLEKDLEQCRELLRRG